MYDKIHHKKKKKNKLKKKNKNKMVVLEKTLESPLDCKEIKPVNPKWSKPWIFFGRPDIEAEAPILCPPSEKSWLTGKDTDAGGKIEAKREGGRRGWNSYIASPTQWTQIWANSEGTRGQRNLACCTPWGFKSWIQLWLLSNNNISYRWC